MRAMFFFSPLNGVLANDLDPENDPLSVQLISGPSNGSLNLNADGSFVYSHDGSETNADQFVYELSDDHGNSSVGIASFSINPINDPPNTMPDTYVVSGGSLIVGPTNGVAANDFDDDGQDLTVILLSEPNHGSLTMLADGSFTYEPSESFFGTDEFTYAVTDGLVVSPPNTVVLHVNIPLAVGPPLLSPDKPIPTVKVDKAATGETNDSNSVMVSNLPIGRITSGSSSSSDYVGKASTSSESRVTQDVSSSHVGFADDTEESEISWIRQRSSWGDRHGRATTQLVAGKFPIGISSYVLSLFPHHDDSKEVVQELSFQQIAAGTTDVVSTTLTVGYVIWLIRGGTILASALTTLPSWIAFDPLPILNNFDDDEDVDDTSLANLATTGASTSPIGDKDQ